MSHLPAHGAAAPASPPDPLDQIRKYAGREARLREQRERYAVWQSGWVQDKDALMGAVREMYEQEFEDGGKRRVPNIKEWLPHLLAAGRVVTVRGYLDLVTSTDRTSAHEKIAYLLLRTAATHPENLSEMLDLLTQTNWPLEFTWQHILNSLGPAITERLSSDTPSEFHECFGRQRPPAQEPAPATVAPGEGGDTRYDPYTHQPNTVHDLKVLRAHHAAMVNPKFDSKGRVPVTPSGRDCQYITQCCIEEFGADDSAAFVKLQARYGTKTGKTAAEIDETTLSDFANHLRRLNGVATDGGNQVNKLPTDMPNAANQSAGTGANRKKRDQDKPSQDRQNDILATIRGAEVPLTRPELITAMKLKKPGKIGANLAWMVSNHILINIPSRGYWPADEKVPE